MAKKNTGKKKYIPNPDRMWELFQDYKNEIENSEKWVKFQYVGKDGKRVEDKITPPLTTEGFENYVASLKIINDLGDYFSNKNGKYSEFSTICSRIRKEIRQNHIEGGMLGLYNPSITQRLNGLTDKRENKNTQSLNIPKLPDIGNRS